MQVFNRMLWGVMTVLLAGPSMAHAQNSRVVLFEDPALTADRLHYPLLLSEGRGYRMSCASQEDEEALIRGLGFTTVPSQILTTVDEDIIAADPMSNPLLCPSANDFQIKVFASDGPDGLVHYLQFPSAIGSNSFTDRLYIPGCVGLVEALKIDLGQAPNADPAPFFQGKIHEISCLNGTPIDVAPVDFSAWCLKGDRTPAETATVMAMLDATPGGISAMGNAAACRDAEAHLGSVPILNLNGKGVQSLAPLSVLGHLTTLELAGNQITDLSPLSKLRALTFLDLSANDISNIVALAPLTTLTRLDLADNQIEDIRFLSALTLLSSLSLSGNVVLDLKPLQFLSGLKELSLARNDLTGDMLEPLTALGGLEALDVSENKIETFNHLGQFPPTVEIDLSGNPIATAAAQSFLDLCILHRDAPTPFGHTIRKLVEKGGGGTCSAVQDLLLVNTTLDLSAQAISDVRPVGILTHLTDLNLSKNAISDVTSLSGLVNLTDLNLSENDITDIRPIGPLTRIRNFDASGNPVSLNDFLSACLMRNQEGKLIEKQAIEVMALIDISGRSTCQEAHDTLRRSQSARATGRGLSTLDYFPVMENLRSLDVSDNALTNLSALSPIQGLTELRVRNNQITSIMGDIVSFRGLEILDISGNPLQNLNGIVHLNKLKRIVFSNTNVRSVQPLASLPLLEAASMRNLSLNFTSFSEYCLVHRFDSIALGAERSFMAAVESAIEVAGVDPRDCEAAEQWVRNLKSLNLNKKNIPSIEPIIFFTALQDLYLYDNVIRDAQPISRLPQLKTLNLTSNRLTALPRFQSTQMKVLSLNNNDISSISNLSNLTQLTNLNLKDNKIIDPSAVASFSKLTWLDLRENKIGPITQVLSVLGKKPFLKDNPICQVPLHLHVAQVRAIQEACRREPLDPAVVRGTILGRNQNIILNRRVVRPISPP